MAGPHCAGVLTQAHYSESLALLMCLQLVWPGLAHQLLLSLRLQQTDAQVS